jgi:hypothetical protein
MAFSKTSRRKGEHGLFRFGKSRPFERSNNCPLGQIEGVFLKKSIPSGFLQNGGFFDSITSLINSN